MLAPRSRVALVTALACVLAADLGCKKASDAQPPAASSAPAEPDASAEAPPPDEEDSPYLDVSNFNKKVEEHSGEIVGCYRDILGDGADPPTGRVKSTIVVDGDGRVKAVTFDPQRSTLKHDGLLACMQDKIKGWRFNIVLTGADSPMPYTFDLTEGALLAK